MKKFIVKALIFSAPILIYIGYNAYAILILPLDAYTFRVWEALKVYEETPVLSGPFYPNMYMEKTELGDLQGRDKHGVAKQVVWHTDKYGFRKEETGRKSHEIVILGDSLTAGSSLTQKDLLSEKLESALGVSVYPFAPYTDMNRYLDEKRFTDNPPELILIESAEKLVLSLPEIIPESQKVKEKTTLSTLLFRKLGLSDPFIIKLAILDDRLKKKAFVNYLYARLTKIPDKIIGGFLGKGARKEETGATSAVKQKENPNRPDLNGGNKLGMVFYPYPEPYFTDWKEHEIVRVAKTLKKYQDTLAKKGTKLVFMPVPNKENIYWDMILGGKKMNNIQRLIKAARDEGVITIDLNIYYDLYRREPNKLLYHVDDSHWTPYAIDVAVGELVSKLSND